MTHEESRLKRMNRQDFDPPRVVAGGDFEILRHDPFPSLVFFVTVGFIGLHSRLLKLMMVLYIRFEIHCTRLLLLLAGVMYSSTVQ